MALPNSFYPEILLNTHCVSDTRLVLDAGAYMYKHCVGLTF